MRDEHRHPHYAIPGKNAAGIAIGQREVIGRLLDITRAGFQFVTPESIADIHVGAGGVGEFWVRGVMFQGVGKVSHVQAKDGQATIGFAFLHDLSSRNKAFSALLSSLCISILASNSALVVRGGKNSARQLKSSAGMCAGCRSICAK